MTDDDPLRWLVPILERRAYAAAMNDREAAARINAIANLPIGWLLEDPVAMGDGVVLRVTGPAGDELEVAATRL